MSGRRLARKGDRGGALLGDLLARSLAAAGELAREPAFDHEPLVVIGAQLRGQPVFRERPAAPLGDLLEARLGVEGEEMGRAGRPFEHGADRRARRLEPAVQVDRAEDGLERVGEQGRLRPASRALLADAELELFAELQALRIGRQDRAAHELGLELREVSFGHAGMALVEPLDGDEREHRVAQELEPFVVLLAPLMFVGGGSVGHREVEQLGPLELVAEAFLERGKGAATEHDEENVPARAGDRQPAGSNRQRLTSAPRSILTSACWRSTPARRSECSWRTKSSRWSSSSWSWSIRSCMLRTTSTPARLTPSSRVRVRIIS